MIDLTNTITAGGAAFGETFAGIEWVFDPAFGDTIRGYELANCLEGRGGNDMLYGAEGNDQLQGGAGSDQLVGTGGTTTLTGDGGGAPLATDVMVALGGTNFLSEAQFATSGGNPIWVDQLGERWSREFGPAAKL